jgi:ABC-type transporter Mla subunit MlaD
MNPAMEARVGIFALVALILLLYAQAWLKSFSLFDKPQRFAAEFSDVAGLSRNATVNVQGVRVGTVEFMEFLPTKKILVHLKITDPTAHVPEGSKVSIQTLGLVGAKYVEIVIPHDANGNAINAPEIANNAILVPPQVENPTRVELVMNRVATRIDEIVSSIDTSAASQAINNFNQAATKLNHNMDRLKDAASSVQTASNNIANTAGRFGKTADNATIAADRASNFFSQGNVTLRDIDAVAKDFRGTSGRINKLLGNPNFSGDLRETVIQARQTADTIRAAIGDVNSTLKDKELRGEVVGILQKLQASTDNIKQSMDIVQTMSKDQGLRNDLKEVVKGAREAMEKANTLLGDPLFKGDVQSTMQKVRNAATDVDVAAKQIRQVLNKRAPLLQMLFGRPGKLKVEEVTPPVVVPATPVIIPATPVTAPVPGGTR